MNAIRERIIWLYNIVQRLPEKSKKFLEIKLYKNYPTISVFCSDCLVYTSHYAYKLRDKDTPTICSDANGDYGKSILKHFEKVYYDSQPISEWIYDNYQHLEANSEKPIFQIKYSGIFLQKTNGELIFQRRDDRDDIENRGMLSVFGGRAKNNEEPIDTALRELKEETGLIISSNKLIFMTEGPYPICKNECMWCSYFLVKDVDEGQIELNEGSDIEKYLMKDASQRKDLTDFPKKILKDLIEQREGQGKRQGKGAGHHK